MRRVFFIAVAACVASVSAVATAQTPGAWKPACNVELVAASAADGGSDHLARLLQKLFQEQKIIGVPMTVINKPASGGVVSTCF